MKCPKCGFKKFERVIIPALPNPYSLETPKEFKRRPFEKIKCLKCGYALKD